uniref:Dynein regulatory complex protein 10 n=1 Tax=Chromera velia CCMP2878 TaxID=1169474 RepID=A0A0G4FSP4_9ALVE|eukprot:Cvel_18481.t1-p1 / transcript=Cvel_18481.t1 / gene=Cvel_18481 / organism=Chromera_velia_CCMP2878 / gene_product=IQ domain-containing protein D, putative / transcript_product=IQ domain-containing protein D, putative / location=Cvel_scaffold1532:24429-28096(+) / protein_length=389 / sequence_SO=supercontig / SO=protein_coding / is_pseudo=false
MPSGKPMNIDAQRVLAITEELIKKLTYLSMIDPKVVENLKQEDGEATASLLGPELMGRIEQQVQIEILYEKNHTDQNGIFVPPTEDGELSPQTLEHIETMQRNARELCRLMDSPEIVQALRGLQESRNSNLKELASTVHDMTSIVEKKLTTTVEEDNSRREVLTHYRTRVELASKRKKELDRDLQLIIQDREKSQAGRREKITKLKADIDDVQDTTEVKLKVLREKYEARERDHTERFTKREAELQKTIADFRTSNDTLRKDAGKEEDRRKKDAKNREVELFRIIEQYDQEMFEKQENFDAILSEYSSELHSMERLRELNARTEAEAERNRQEKEIETAREQLLSQSKSRRDRLANFLQAWWRGVKQREDFMKMKKAAKKKRKGKKGKK